MMAGYKIIIKNQEERGYIVD